METLDWDTASDIGMALLNRSMIGQTNLLAVSGAANSKRLEVIGQDLNPGRP